jgi:8-oxo-dGTP pyrophosphatase MutT (NUDIX family)
MGVSNRHWGEKALQEKAKMGYAVWMERRIAEILASRPLKEITREDLVPSAVLVLLLERDGEDYILLTKRSDKVDCHKGEVSFPGGRVDPGDANLLEAALREGAEEIGLAPHDVTILGRLDDTQTVTTGFVVTPYVGRIPYPYSFRINQEEIAELIFVPVQALAADSAANASGVAGEGKGAGSPRFQYRNHVIWGATARILSQFLDITIPTRDGGHRGATTGATGSPSSRCKESKA